ncbi:hypothetical protein BN1013_01626 [Candidatus Rubidus massiliensis]|nr:hypothetical protein BN1013_01626 [Candidatus Rubidus massiliensis]
MLASLFFCLGFLSLDSETLEVINTSLLFIKRIISMIGTVIILTGALYALYQFILQIKNVKVKNQTLNFDLIRLDLGRSIILGLEFIVASDVIETTTAPDYYSLGILGGIVLIRTFLNYSLNKDITQLGEREQVRQKTI